MNKSLHRGRSYHYLVLFMLHLALHPEPTEIHAMLFIRSAWFVSMAANGVFCREMRIVVHSTLCSYKAYRWKSIPGTSLMITDRGARCVLGHRCVLRGHSPASRSSVPCGGRRARGRGLSWLAGPGWCAWHENDWAGARRFLSASASTDPTTPGDIEGG
jgi:hypothetical protein